ncbi:MAG TPA: T9SS type A sorting domain-containing protein [Bacteroidota bacterium]|nr:T9SS type A sorting domain-containing protein [Bacteroidota bacterium]
MRFATISSLCVLILISLVPSRAAQGWSCKPDTTVPVVTANGNQWNVQIASDAHHGAVVVWQDRRNGASDKLYVQRIAADGTMLWADGGIPIASTPGYQYYPQIIGDGAGGAFIAWQDNRDGVGYDIYLQHVSASGGMLLQPDGLPLCKAAGHQYYPKIVPSPGGEVIVVWQDRRTGNFDIYAQRVNALGDLLWTPNGMLVCNSEFDQIDPVTAPDGSGGAVIAWSDYRGASGFTDIYAQRLKWNGGAAWKLNGVPVSQSVNNQWNPQIITDGNAGAFVAWQDRRNSFYDLAYAQRVDSNGTKIWAENGLPLAPIEANQYYPRITSDGSGGAVAVWQDNRGGADYDIYSQRVNDAGQMLWSANGRAVSTATGHQYYPQVVHQAGSFVFAWQDRRGGTYDIFSQRIDLAGDIRWDLNGVAVTSSPNDQYIPQLAADGFEGALLAWADFQLGTGATDIFANRIGSNGLPAGGCFRTFNQDSLTKRGARIRRTASGMPNEGNVRDTIFGRGVFSQGMIVGVDRYDSAKRYGWIYYKKSYYVRRTLPQIGESRGFDRRFDKPFLGALKNPTRYRYNNSVVGELIALKLNIAASDVGITPSRFGDLKFMEESHPGDPFNGLSLREVARRTDSMLTYWRAYPGLDYNDVHNSLRRINHAFDGPVDTVSLRPLRITPVNTLFSLDFLVPNTDPPAEIPQYLSAENVPEEEYGFRLEQNYPNPFNPTTTIEFNLATPSAVTLRIYDLTGREVASLFDNAPLEDGFHAVDFDADNLSSGIYFYRIMAVPRNGAEKPLTLVRKMVLVK